MMDKIVSLTGRALTNTAADPAIIARLEDALARARSGDIIGIAIAELHRNGATQHGWDGIGPVSVLGEIARMSIRLAHSIED